ncbi:MAG: ECF transporter S component [Anaerolineales bacterium]|nr:ECF transporter S component [Anaerolineales bacterium]
MDNLKRSFSTVTLVLIPVAIAINIAVGQLALFVKIPVYLDSIGTILVGVLAGPWAGAVTGFLSNVIWTLTGWYTPAIAFGGVAAIIGALAGVFGRAGWPNVWWKAILAGLLTGLTAAVLSAPIATYVFGGVMGSGTDAVVAMARSIGLDSLGANIAQGTFSDPIDKMATYLIVFLVLRALPLRFLARFTNLKARGG